MSRGFLCDNCHCYNVFYGNCRLHCYNCPPTEEKLIAMTIDEFLASLAKKQTSSLVNNDQETLKGGEK